LKLRRHEIKRIVEAVTDHCFLNKHLNDLKYNDDPLCSCKLEKETGMHIIGSCPKFRTIRNTFLGKTTLKKEEMNLKKIKIHHLTNFLKRTNKFL